MKIRTIAFTYLIFGLFFFLLGVPLFGAANTVGNPIVFVWELRDPSLLLSVAGIVVSVASIFFLALTLHVFREVFFGEKSSIN